MCFHGKQGTFTGLCIDSEFLCKLRCQDNQIRSGVPLLAPVVWLVSFPFEFSLIQNRHNRSVFFFNVPHFCNKGRVYCMSIFLYLNGAVQVLYFFLSLQSPSP